MKTLTTLTLMLLSIAGTAQLNYLSSFSVGANSSTGDRMQRSVVDDSLNTYTLLYLTGTVDIDPTAATVNAVGQQLVKYAADGSVVWNKQFAMTGTTAWGGIDLDPWGNIIVTGDFANTVDFDPNAGVFNLSCSSNRETFVVKLTNNGDFIWAFDLDGCYTNKGYDVATDTSGNIFVAGAFTCDIDLDPSTGLVEESNNLFQDQYIVKYDSAGNYIWHNRITSSGSAIEVPNDLLINMDQNPVFVGNCLVSSDFQIGAGNYFLGFNGGFIAEYDGMSGSILWANGVQAVVGVPQAAWRVGQDNSGNYYMTGAYSDTADLDPLGAGQIMSPLGPEDGYIVKYDNSGNFLWGDIISGADLTSIGESLLILPNNNVIWCTGNDSLFIKELSPNGSLMWIDTLPGDLWTYTAGISLSGTEVHLWVAYQGTFYPDPDNGSVSETSAGNYDVLRVVYGIANQEPVIQTSGPQNICHNDTITINIPITDEDIAGLSLSFNSSNPSVVSNGNISISNSGSGAELTISGTAGLGSVWIQVVAVDTGGLSGTDSVMIEVHPVYDLITYTSVCDGDSLLWDGTYYSTAGSYTNNYTTIMGCDSVRTLNLSLDPVYSIMDTIIISQGDSIMLGGAYQTTSGTYVDNFVTTMGCDSTISTVLNVVTGVMPPETFTFSMYPNPTVDKVFIQSSAINGVIEVMNLTGKMIYREVISGREITINLSEVSSGLYFVKVRFKGYQNTQKLIVK